MLRRQFARRGTFYDGPARSDTVPADGPAKLIRAASVPLHAPCGRDMRRDGQLQGLLWAEMPAWTACRRLLRARLRVQASARACYFHPRAAPVAPRVGCNSHGMVVFQCWWAMSGILRDISGVAGHRVQGFPPASPP